MVIYISLKSKFKEKEEITGISSKPKNYTKKNPKKQNKNKKANEKKNKNKKNIQIKTNTILLLTQNKQTSKKKKNETIFSKKVSRGK